MTTSRAAGALLALVLPLSALAKDRPLDTVVAKRGDAELTLGLFDARILELPPEHRAGFVDDAQRLEDTIRQTLLMQQLANEARAAGLDKDPQFAYQVKLAEERILAYYRTQQLAQQEAKGDFAALAKEVYLSNKKAYAEPDAVVVRHVLIKTECRGEEEALKLAQQIHRDALDGKDMAALAKEHSEDRGAKEDGGLLPEILPGKTEAVFEEAVFALTKPGQIAPLVKTRHGYHVIQLVERKTGRVPPFAEVESKIVAKLKADESARIQREHGERLQGLKLDFDPEVIGELRTRFGEGPNAGVATQRSAPPSN